VRYTKAKHGKRFAKSTGRHRHIYGFSAGKPMHRATIVTAWPIAAGVGNSLRKER
jgi:hypothetical protein